MTTEQQINAAGPVGSIARLEKIASLNLGERSESAKRVLAKRYEYKRLISEGYAPEHARLIIK